MMPTLAVLIGLSLFSFDVKADVPSVQAGPEALEKAEAIQVPVHKVIVYSDRAQVFRKTNLSIKKGTNLIRIDDLPGSLARNTLRVGTIGAQVLRIQPNLVQKERFKLEEVNTLIEQMKGIQEKISLLNKKRTAYQNEINILSQATPKAPIFERERSSTASLSTSSWSTSLDFLDKRRKNARRAIQDIDIQARKHQKELYTLKRKSAPYQIGNASEDRVELVAIIHSEKKQTVALSLQYFIEGAYWVPSYDLYYDPKENKATIQTAGMVTQTTGENWDDVELHLSTSIPSGNIDLPKLQTWTLGEKNEYIPRAKATKRPPYVRPFSPPSRTTTLAEAKKLSEQEFLISRIRYLRSLLRQVQAPSQSLGYIAQAEESEKKYEVASESYDSYDVPDVIYKEKTEIDFEAVDIEGQLRKPQGLLMQERAKAEFSPMIELRGDFNDSTGLEDMSADLDVPVTAFARNEPLAKRASQSSRSMGLYASNHYSKSYFSNRNLPAVLANGLDYLWKAPSKATIPSNGKQFRISLRSDTFPVESFYEATPSIKEVAYLKASVQNPGTQAILKGSTNIFIDKSFAGQGTLETTGPGGFLELPLGADEDIRLVRTIIPKQRTEGVFNKEDITDYSVRIEVGNYKKHDINIRIYDQIPISKQEKVKIELQSIEPTANKPNIQGVFYWDVIIPSQKTKALEFRYSITRPKDWIIRGY